jgi:hypothetical protein
LREALSHRDLQEVLSTTVRPLSQSDLTGMAATSPAAQRVQALQKMADARALRMKPPVQSYVSVTSGDKDTKADYVTLNSIAFGKQIAGGTIENFGVSDFSGLGEGEKIALVGHGEPGKSGEYTGAAMPRNSL